jgi:tyrosine-protein phosphatase YwqE
MFRFFNKSTTNKLLPFQVDIHSHLLPGLDDGVKSMEESVYIIKILKSLGYKKIITTPHVMHDHYQNSSEDILVRTSQLKQYLEKKNLKIEFEAAAEYYLDEKFISNLSDGEEFLTFGEKYLLFETSFINKPAFLEDAVFNMNTNGYQPVLAHPERYIYLQSNKKLIEQLKNMNVLFQLNMLSLHGYYSPEIKKNAQNLLKMNVIDFIGTDCHSALQADEIMKLMNKKNRQLSSLNVMNKTLL